MGVRRISKEEAARLVYDSLNKMEEGITDYVFHKIEKRTKDVLIVRVSYIWSLHGHKKPVKNIQCAFSVHFITRTVNGYE